MNDNERMKYDPSHAVFPIHSFIHQSSIIHHIKIKFNKQIKIFNIGNDNIYHFKRLDVTNRYIGDTHCFVICVVLLFKPARDYWNSINEFSIIY